MRRLAGIYLMVAAAAAACGGGSEPPDRAAPAEPEARYVPGEEPLETATVGGDEVLTLPGETGPAVETPRPCGWSSAWSKPDVPNPLLAGVGGVPMPTRVSDAAILVPESDRPRSEVVAELVIATDGSVYETTLVRRPEPPWPEAEDALLKALRAFRYEPASLDGTPISICTTLMLSLGGP